jgi:hypothetical protein
MSNPEPPDESPDPMWLDQYERDFEWESLQDDAQPDEPS